MKLHAAIPAGGRGEPFVIRGARLAVAPNRSLSGDLEISGGRIHAIHPAHHRSTHSIELDLAGYLLLPGFVNAHDHLEFALYPRLGNPPYRNYIEWGEDIHARFPKIISRQHTVPKEVRLWWGGLRNLLSGVTTVCHHNALYPELTRPDFPVRVVQKYGWAHSPALGGDLRAARALTPVGRPFIVHACEGVDARSREELQVLEQLRILDKYAVLVHGLALTDAEVALIRRREASIILCPSSNYFLFGKLPDFNLLGGMRSIALGSDSPLTAAGDLLDEIQFALHNCGIEPRRAFRLVTSDAARVLRLKQSEGSIRQGGVADLVAIRDNGCDAAKRLPSLSTNEIELVILGGVVQLASQAIRERLPASATRGLESLAIDSVATSLVRWVRAPVAELFEKAEAALGEGQVRLGGRSVRVTASAQPPSVGAVHAC